MPRVEVYCQLHHYILVLSAYLNIKLEKQTILPKGSLKASRNELRTEQSAVLKSMISYSRRNASLLPMALSLNEPQAFQLMA